LIAATASAFLGELPTFGYAVAKVVREEESSDAAIAACSRAITSAKWTGPRLAAIYYNRGAIHGKRHDFDSAIVDYNQAIRLDPQNVDAHINRGVAYYAKGDSDRAIADYERALRLDPNNADAYNNRGVAYFGPTNPNRHF
jgi:tetratricopeptide (TPR) repeat protein